MADVQDEIVQLDHIGVATRNVEDVRKAWKRVFGVEGETHLYPEVNMKGLIIPLGPSHFKFTETTAPNERWDNYIEEHGEGINHIAIQVKDLEKVTKKLEEDGVEFRHEEPQHFADGICNFIDLEDLLVTVELLELQPNWKEIKFKAYE